MIRSRCWTVEIAIDEHGDERLTRAHARLRRPEGPDVRGTGAARRSPHDPEVPEIGDELAVARALSEVVHGLVDAAATDIEQVTHKRVSRLRV